jgi:hypothetical protein
MTLTPYLRTAAMGLLFGIFGGSIPLIVPEPKEEPIKPLVRDYCTEFNKTCSSYCRTMEMDYDDSNLCVKRIDNNVGDFYICNPGALKSRRDTCLKSIEEKLGLCDEVK